VSLWLFFYNQNSEKQQKGTRKIEKERKKERKKERERERRKEEKEKENPVGSFTNFW
jgi:hypothetical protein